MSDETDNRPRRSFVLISEDHPDIARLGILVEIFLEMDRDETNRTIAYLKDRFVINRKGDTGAVQ